VRFTQRIKQEWEYDDEYNNCKAAYGPYDPQSEEREDFVVRYYWGDKPWKHNLKRVERKIDEEHWSKTEYEHNERGQVVEVRVWVDQQRYRRRVYEYYEETDPQSGALLGMLHRERIDMQTDDPDDDIVTQHNEYYITGYVWRTYRPYRAGDGPAAFTEYLYDMDYDVDTGQWKRRPVFGLLAKQVDAAGCATLFSYNGAGELTRRIDNFINGIPADFDPNQDTDPDSFPLDDIITLYQRDALGRIEQTVHNYYKLPTTDPYANITYRNKYLANGWLDESHGPDGSVTKYTYYRNGWLKTTEVLIDEDRWSITTYTYYPDGSLKTTTDPDGGITSREYDFAGRLVLLTDPCNRQTAYTYDARSNTIKTIYGYNTANPQVWRNTYNAASWLVISEDPTNIQTTYTYNLAGDTLTVTTAANTNSWLRTINTYDTAGRLFSTTTQTPQRTLPETRYTYLPDGSTEKIETPLWYEDATVVYQTVKMEYDAAGRLIARITNPSEPEEYRESYTYNILSWQTDTYAACGTPDETRTHSVFARTGWVIKSYTVNPEGPADLYATRTYYTLSGLVKKVVDPQQWADNDNSPDPRNTSYTYNKAGWLIRVTNAAGTPTQYRYSNAGRRIQLLYWQEPPFTEETAIRVYYEYHPDGSLKSINQPGFEGRDITTFDYDDFGNLTLKTKPDTTQIRYIYDSLNRLASATTAQ